MSAALQSSSEESTIEQRQRDVSQKIHGILLHPLAGVIGIVDEMLALCSDARLNLDWDREKCSVRSFDGNWKTVVEVPLQKSVFRAIIARVAELCDDQLPDSASPYSGQGHLRGSGGNGLGIRAKFENTTEKQQIQLEATLPPS